MTCSMCSRRQNATVNGICFGCIETVAPHALTFSIDGRFRFATRLSDGHWTTVDRGDVIVFQGSMGAFMQVTPNDDTLALHALRRLAA